MSRLSNTSLSILCSYAYLGNRRQNSFADRAIALHNSGRINLMIDSGAFTKGNGGSKTQHVNIEDYCDWLRTYRDSCEKYVALESNGIRSGISLHQSIINSYISRLHTYCKDRISRTLIALRPVFGQIRCYDIDGVLCKEDGTLCFEEKEPIRKNIDRINQSPGLRVLYTARLESDRNATEKWLKKNGVQYDLLLTNKTPYDTLFDDNVVRI